MKKEIVVAALENNDYNKEIVGVKTNVTSTHDENGWHDRFTLILSTPYRPCPNYDVYNSDGVVIGRDC